MAQKLSLLLQANMPSHHHNGGEHTHGLAPHDHTASFHVSSSGPNTDVALNNSLANWGGTGTNVQATGQANGDALSSESVRVAASAAASTGNNTGNQTSAAGGSQAVQKRSPYLSMLYCVNTVGIFPSRS